MNRSRGRPRKGSDDAQARLVSAAQTLFPERGYEGTTVRAIAAEAHCDPALVSYHFGSKSGLFAHVMTLALSPASVLAAALPGDPSAVGARLVAHVLRAWDEPRIAEPLAQLVHASMADEEVMRAFREYIDRELMQRLVEYLRGPDATARATSIMTLVIGVIFSRYVVRVPSVADQSLDDYWAAVTPLAQATSSRTRRPAS